MISGKNISVSPLVCLCLPSQSRRLGLHPPTASKVLIFITSLACLAGLAFWEASKMALCIDIVITSFIILAILRSPQRQELHKVICYRSAKCSYYGQILLSIMPVQPQGLAPVSLKAELEMASSGFSLLL